MDLSAKIFASWEERQKLRIFVSLPVKELQYNCCPAVSPLGYCWLRAMVGRRFLWMGEDCSKASGYFALSSSFC
ncbi:hypothetical protein KOY48_04200 [Candidatus Minimicrobia naudis]|uniref:Uncharacterized protein n=1 Tax=Candidatus Minimicrobia naudis TaxID=2841263 RepID=A0A8F1MBM3_9BACT|nr:hypothetical protein KOY48_04200 [Candidatus Minimicrobia naudis]